MNSPEANYKVAIREEKENKTHTNKIKKMVIYII
jgi:hypothetical protein